MPVDRPGVYVEHPQPLTALVGSRTTQVRCEGVELRPAHLLAGPAEKVLGPLGGGGVETSCLALGLAGAAIEQLALEARARAALAPLAERFEQVRGTLRRRLLALAGGAADPARTLALRVDCTRLALRATQAYLAVAKGTGFVAPHPAQRWARQALFFLVWSCPRPAAEGILTDLIPPMPEGE
jgi:alkylation response protein AidB-like acyl-CoA dehydrogenase